jgi:hypothetical protein
LGLPAGYKLRKHIAKALQARSRAVRTALANYNTAGARLSPPCEPLNWEQVVDYACLSDFDLLRDGREDIREEPWAKPAGRIAMDMFFKIERAGEEIRRLDIEIKRLLTYVRDEDDFLRREEVRVCEAAGEAVAHQIRVYRMRQGRFHDEHRYRLYRLRKLPGFTGSLEPGTAIDKDRQAGAATEVLQDITPSLPPPADSDSEDSEDEAEILAEQYALLSIAEDSGGVQEK